LINIGNAFIIVNFVQGKHKLNSSTGGFSASTYEGSAARKADKENINPHQLSLSKGSTQEFPQLRLKIFGQKSQETHYFSPETCEEPISIGRNAGCKIQIEDLVLSKFQCVIEFDHESKTWMLLDGNGQKKSMNGTWLYLS